MSLRKWPLGPSKGGADVVALHRLGKQPIFPPVADGGTRSACLGEATGEDRVASAGLLQLAQQLQIDHKSVMGKTGFRGNFRVDLAMIKLVANMRQKGLTGVNSF